MRIFTSEFAHDYSTYSFGYTLHAAYEPTDDLKEIYDSGFLPYSGDPNAYNLMYMARSVRVRIPEFQATSENRRIFRKFDDTFVARILTQTELQTDTEFQELFLNYFKTRHGAGVMGEERLKGILNSALPLRGIRYETKDGALAAAVFEPAGNSWTHFWFPAYDPSYIGSSFGMWLMLDGVRRAEKEKKAHLYLGTAYGEKARYKLNIPNLEFWNGEQWVYDEKLLKQAMHSDEQRHASCGTTFEKR